jgi:hypothetical protein
MKPVHKVQLATRIWGLALYVHLTTRTRPLPEVVASLAGRSPRRPYGLGPIRLGSIVTRALTIGGRPPRCVIAALVAFRLNRSEGHPVELVIGLPQHPTDKDAHAWLEMAGRDVGPPPGRLGHLELARYS